jgi:uncharacterized protein
METLPAGPAVGPLDLLVLQPTPFCNIDCTYCYLPDRASKRQMSAELLDLVFARVFASGLVERPFTVVWHAGEPLVLPAAYYEQALALLARHNSAGVEVHQSFQTNGTLIDEQWCAFIKAHPVRVGVSIDGPAFLHDRCRRTRRGDGTHERVLRGMRLLREHGIGFHVITVLTRPSLDYPDELYEFYREQGIDYVGFNVEEVEGPNTQSSLQTHDARAELTRFLGRFYDLASSGDWKLRVREFDGALAALALADGGELPAGHETTPLAILSVDCEGNFTTFSPELLGLKSDRFGDFALGRVQTDSFPSVLGTARFQAMRAEIDAGVQRCRQTCAYFPFCGGGAPVNKYFENGSFDSTETLFCRLSKQAVLDVVLAKLERPPARPDSPVPPTAHATRKRLSLL